MRSADRSGLRWLLAELPELVNQGVVPPETAESLRRHYSSDTEAPRRLGFILSAILGSLLVGAGIVLLVAHNWDFLSRTTRCAIAFAPLILSQALAIFVFLRRNNSTAWRESAAILNVASIGTGIALVSQTYQIQGDLAVHPGLDAPFAPGRLFVQDEHRPCRLVRRGRGLGYLAENRKPLRGPA
ncbi:MAG TPA: DUF2157 domain-containing protein [Chthoniobacterales bacterium]|jgi:uncharacterized membrane protein|nr:DUF2157 domain-containing protein [Chthoniobacterales bacterium]